MIRGLDFVLLPTRDMNRAVTFYRDMLGLPLTMHAEGKWAEFDLGGNTLGLWDPSIAGQEFEPVRVGTVALGVDDVEATVAALKAKGLTLDDETMDSGVCHMRMFHDPDGNALMLHHRYASEA